MEKRDIIFRGRRVDTGEWIFGHFLKSNKADKTWYIVADVLNSELVVVDPETVGQFTGLLDKNGARIFEGDIVETDDYSEGAFFGVNQPKKILLVKYESLITGIGFELLHKDSAIVLGNIHDNKDLLK